MTPSSTPPPVLYTTREVATLLRCSIRKVQYLIADGTLAAVQVGKHYRVSQPALQAMLEIQATRRPAGEEGDGSCDGTSVVR